MSPRKGYCYFFGVQKLVEAMVLSQPISAFSPVVSQIKSCPGECHQLTNLSVLLRRLFFFMAPPQQASVPVPVLGRMPGVGFRLVKSPPHLFYI